jgi:hypothetical protein
MNTGRAEAGQRREQEKTNGREGLLPAQAHDGRSRHEPVDSRPDHENARASGASSSSSTKLRSEIDTRLHALREGIEEWSGHAREKFLRELDGVRDWIKRGLQ